MATEREKLNETGSPIEDIRSQGLSLREHANIFQTATISTIKGADPESGKFTRARRLLALRDKERQVLGRKRRDKVSYAERRQYVADSPALGTVRALYQNLGVAEMLTMGDWSVSRFKEVSEAFGTVPIKDIQCLLLQFYSENGYLSTTESIDEGRLIHMDLGCGNGSLCERLRNDTTTTPFGNEHLLHEYWSEFGFADRIYFTINDLLLTQIREEYTEDAGLIQFIHLVSRLIMRMVFSAQSSQAESSKKHKALSQLAKDPNRVREIIEDLEHYLPELKKIVQESKKRTPRIKADKEFLLDDDMDIDGVCIDKIKEFLRNRNREIFFNKYFKDGLYPNTETAGISEAFAELGREIPEIQAEIDALNREISRGTDEKSDLIQRKYRLKKQLDALRERRDKLIESPNNLARSITIFPHNVVIGCFEDFGEIYPDVPAFNFVHASRSSSHAEDAGYGNVTFEAAKRLKAGGIMLDDGKRESYTRYERIEQLKSMKVKLGGEYKIGIIIDPKGKRGMSVLIERAINGQDGRPSFFSDQYMGRLLSEGCTYMSLDDFDESFLVIEIKNGVIDKLRRLLITENPGDDHWAKVFAGRMQFRGLHHHIDPTVDDLTAGLSAEQKKADKDSIVEHALEQIRKKVRVIDRKERLVREGRIPAMEEENMSLVQTFPSLTHGSDHQNSFDINVARYFRAADLPTNANVPDFNKLEGERLVLIGALRRLHNRLGVPPIVVVEFDECFTNPMLGGVLADILHNPETAKLFEIQHVSLRELERGKEPKYPEINDNRIYILGGSLNDAYDAAGAHFTDRFSKVLVDRIMQQDSVRALGICFGSQSLLQAYGQQLGRGFRTEKGALQFGAFPVEFADEDIFPGLKGQTCTAAFTRSGYSIIEGCGDIPGMRPLAFEPTQEGIRLPPVAWSLLDGKIITTQFHPDIRLSSRQHLEVLRKYLQRAWPATESTIPSAVKLNRRRPLSPLGIFQSNLDIQAEEASGIITPWVQRDLSMPILVPALKRFAESLLKV